jgi:hypothetical protein
VPVFGGSARRGPLRTDLARGRKTTSPLTLFRVKERQAPIATCGNPKHAGQRGSIPHHTPMLRKWCYPSATQSPRRDPIPDREEVGDAMVRSAKRREGQPVTPAQIRQRLADVAASLRGAMPTGRLESDSEAGARRLVQRINQLPDEHAVLMELAELVQTEADWRTLSAQIQQPEFPLTGVNETDFRPFFDEVLRLARAL